MKYVGIFLTFFVAYLCAMEDAADLASRVQHMDEGWHLSCAQARFFIETALMNIQVVRAEELNPKKYDHVCWLLHAVVAERLQQLRDESRAKKSASLQELLATFPEWLDQVRECIRSGKWQKQEMVYTPELRVHDVVVLPPIGINTTTLALQEIDENAQKAVYGVILYCRSESEKYTRVLMHVPAFSSCAIL